ncbi:MAG: hypothetical protein CFE45_16720 [Burkholderiales bacterium PBB5]|nr:MAG: hypothetical protein CFE45_16720 [Burkholderiales bacterium PBB5]
MLPLPRCLPAWALAAALLGAGWWPARAAEPPTTQAGVRFEPRLQLGGQALQLNGSGLRAVLFLKGYAAALYLPQRAATADAVLAQPGPKRLQMRLLLDVPAAEFSKALHVGIARNLPAEQQGALTERVARFDALLQALGTVKKGDAVNLDYLPGQGLQFWLNGRLQGAAIPGDDFYGALLRVFIGAHVSDDKLRAGLLGQSA